MAIIVVDSVLFLVFLFCGFESENVFLSLLIGILVVILATIAITNSEEEILSEDKLKQNQEQEKKEWDEWRYNQEDDK